MSRLPSKLTYSNVISTLCLILLLGGGTAYAASELGKESVGTKQLAKGAVTPAKLSKASKQTLIGAAGPTGAQGPQGSPGAKGDTGGQGEPGSSQFPATLPSGVTEHGIYGMSGQRSNPSPPLDLPGTSISFPISLASQPHHEKIATGGSATAHCPGSWDEPKAAPGYLCVYEKQALNSSVSIVTIEPAFAKYGFELSGDPAEGAIYGMEGTWAVTAE